MNDRLQIAAMAMQTLLKRAKKPFTFQEIAHDALGYADALIAAAGDGGMSEKPTSHSDPIKGRMGGSYYDYVLMEGERRVIAMGIKDEIYIINDEKVTPIEFSTTLLNAIDMLSSSSSEIPNNSEPIKSDWNIRSCFEGLREWQGRYDNQGHIILTREHQGEICDLVEKHYKPSVPSVEEIKKTIDFYNEGETITIFGLAEAIHQWLTERGAK